MNFLAVNWLNISINVLLVIHVFVCLILCLIVLMQRPKQEGLGAAFGGDTMSELTGAKATDFLQKGTAYVGSLFFIITFALAILVSAKNKRDDSSLSNGSENPPKTENVTTDGESTADVVKGGLDTGDIAGGGETEEEEEPKEDDKTEGETTEKTEGEGKTEGETTEKPEGEDKPAAE